nr:unnamed protein product [Callosobruchus chinensis]
MIRANIELFSEKNIYFSMQTTLEGAVKIMKKTHNKLILVSVVGQSMEAAILETANEVAKLAYKICWLIIADYQFRNTINGLRATNISIDADIVLAIDLATEKTTKDTGGHNEDSNTTVVTNLEKSEAVTKPVLPYFDGNDEEFDIMSLCDHKKNQMKETAGFCLLQLYKIRMELNNSFVINGMGNWDDIKPVCVTKSLTSIEQRTNFHRFPLIIGHRNASTKEIVSETPFLAYDTFDENLLEFFTYITGFLNSSESEVLFAKVGSKSTEGVWTDLLGALIRGEIDVALECFLKMPHSVSDIPLTQDVMKSCKNIYVQPEPSNAFRNIYLEPFDERLILCVVGTGIALSVGLTIAHRAALKYQRQERRRPFGIIGSLIWCAGVFCQQGSIWEPTLYSDQIIVLISLLFTLLIYNSYSAFITSVLSITLADIRTVQDLLESNYEIGYEKNSQDEVYLRTTNNSQLNQIYLRGYLANITNITEGLLRATKGGYGFFASGEDARRALMNISLHKCQYDVQEIPIRFTKHSVAFGVAKHSPYKQLINLSIIRMYETGIHKYITSLLFAPLIQCEARKTYNSARFSDISSAFLLLCLGYICSLIFLALECIWRNRRTIYRYCRRLRRRQPRLVFKGYLP